MKEHQARGLGKLEVQAQLCCELAEALSVSISPVKWELDRPRGVLSGSLRLVGALSFLCFFICL